MLAEAIQAIVNLASKGFGVQTIKADGFEDRVGLVGADGSVNWMMKPTPSGTAVVESVDSFAAVVKREDAAEIYLDSGLAVAVLDRHRSQTAKLELKTTAQQIALVGLLGKDLTPKQAIDGLRFEVGGFGTDDVVAALRVVSFENGRVETSSIGRGSESFGKSVTSKVAAGGATIPESFSVTIPWFDVRGLEDVVVSIRIFVDVKAAEGKIRFVDAPGQIEAAERSSLDQARNALQSALDKASEIASISSADADGSTHEALLYHPRRFEVLLGRPEFLRK